MSTTISKNEYVKFEGKKKKVSLENLSVVIYMGENPKLERVSLDKLFVKDGKKARPVKSYSDFVSNLKKDNVFNGSSLMQKITHNLSKEDIQVQIKGIDVPENYTSIVINSQKTEDGIVPYGLKRSLKVQVASSEDKAEDKYYFVEIAGKGEFFKPNEIYYYDKSNKKVLLSEVKNLDKLTDVQFFADGKKVDMVYTEKQYVFPSLNAKETVDFKTMEKTTFSEKKSKDNKLNFETSTQKLDRFFSEQKYVRKEVEEEVKLGKRYKNVTKEQSFIQIRNFQRRPNGEYCAVTIDGFTKMVKLENLVDEYGMPIENIKNMVGKVLQIKEDGKIISITSPLTYEQANSTYSTLKTFQETEKEAGENTYLRLKNGEYVKETEVVQPIAYKIVTLKNAEYDAFLVKTINSEGKESFVVVSKDYFEKHGDTSQIKQENAVRIQRCEFNSKDCAVVQTTSKGEEIEQCSIVRKSKILGSEINVEADAKDIAYQGFMAGYNNGDYKLKQVYHNGKLEELSVRNKRYEQTDVSYLPDYADNLHQYKSLNCDDLKIENGKLVGGPKFNIWKGIKNSYATLGNIALNSFGLVMIGGIFTATVGGVFVAAALVGAAVASIPIIPIANAVYGGFKNHQRTKFMDKAEYNQKANKADLEQRMQKLYQRMTDKDYVPYPEARFEDEYAKLVNDIIALSSSSVESNLVVENGVAKVTPENAAAAKAYMAEFKQVEEMLKPAEKDMLSAKASFEKLDVKMKILEDEGKVINPKFQKKYDQAKQEYEQSKKEFSLLSQRRETLMNYKGNPTQLQAHAERDRLLKVADMMRTAVYLKSESFKDNPLVKEAIHGKGGLLDCSDVLTDEDLKEMSKEDLILDTKDKKLQKQFANCKTIEEKIEMIRANEANKSQKMLQNMQMDFKNGLMIDGIGVGLKDEEIMYKAEYGRGYRWEKVKQAVEFVHDGLKVEEPTEMEIPPKGASVPPETEEPKKPEETKPKTSAQEKLYSAQINSEDSLVKLLKSKPENKYRKSLLSFISEKTGVDVDEADIQETIKRIDSKHNPKTGTPKSATAGAKSLKNENIYKILTYGQQYLTEYAKLIKERTAKPEEHSV